MATLRQVYSYTGRQVLKIDKARIDEFLRRAREVSRLLREELGVPDITLKPGVTTPGVVPRSTKLTPRAQEAFTSLKAWCKSL